MVLRHIGPPGAGERVELQRCEAALADGFGRPRIVFRLLHLVAPAVRVGADARTARAADQIVDRLLRDLAHNVPQRLLDPGCRAKELQRAAALRIVVECDLKDVTDVEGIATDEIAVKLFDLRRNGTIAVVLAVGLAPSDYAGVSLDPHENEILPPTGMDRKTFDPGDFHDAPYCIDDRSRGDF